MLDRLKLLKILQGTSVQKQLDQASLPDFLVCEVLPKLKTPCFQKALRDNAQKLGVPSWEGDFGQSKKADEQKKPYSVLAVDGSQISPDRHSAGHNLALIQVGGVLLDYGAQSSARHQQRLELVDGRAFQDKEFDSALVEQLRDVLELETALQWAKEQRKKPLVLMDGSLAFLAGRFGDPAKAASPKLSQRFFKAIDEFSQLGLDLVFYTSVPSARTFMSLVKICLCLAPYFDKQSCSGACGQTSCQVLSGRTDSGLFEGVLPGWSASQVFAFNVFELAIESVFINTGKDGARWFGETARVEVLSKNGNIDAVLSKVFDQVAKGFGYPVGSSEAHEQAVLSFSDKEVFDQLASQTCGSGRGKISRKLFSKRVVGF